MGESVRETVMGIKIALEHWFVSIEMAILMFQDVVTVDLVIFLIWIIVFSRLQNNQLILLRSRLQNHQQNHQQNLQQDHQLILLRSRLYQTLFLSNRNQGQVVNTEKRLVKLMDRCGLTMDVVEYSNVLDNKSYAKVRVMLTLCVRAKLHNVLKYFELFF